MRIEIDDLSRPAVIALIEEHLRNMHELSPPEEVFAFDAGKLKALDVTFFTAWNGDVLLGCAAQRLAAACDTSPALTRRLPTHLAPRPSH